SILSLISRTTVILLTPSRVAASCRINSPVETLALSIHGDAVLVAEAANAELGPGVPLGRAHPEPVENRSNAPVR
ncbi:MAG: hypothetical protein WA970_05360, partial [Gammaproteobacteria bacterium]